MTPVGHPTGTFCPDPTGAVGCGTLMDRLPEAAEPPAVLKPGAMEGF